MSQQDSPVVATACPETPLILTKRFTYTPNTSPSDIPSRVRSRSLPLCHVETITDKIPDSPFRIHAPNVDSIKTCITESIGSQRHLILPQFVELMSKIAPHVNATDIFHRMDKFHSGQIATNTLLNDEFLARMLLNSYVEYTDHDSESSDTINNDEFNHISAQTEAEIEYNKLQKWIMCNGEPAIARVKELEAMIKVYENDRNNQQIQYSQQQENLAELRNTETDLKQKLSISSKLLLIEAECADTDNNRLSLEDAVEAYENKLTSKQKLLCLAEEQVQEMKMLNVEYLTQNQQLQVKTKSLQQEKKELQKAILALENEEMIRDQQHFVENRRMKNQINALKSELDNYGHEENDVMPSIVLPADQSVAEIQRAERINRLRRQSLLPTKNDEVFLYLFENDDVCTPTEVTPTADQVNEFGGSFVLPNQPQICNVTFEEKESGANVNPMQSLENENEARDVENEYSLRNIWKAVTEPALLWPFPSIHII